MTQKVNICTEEWCNMVFEGKNKNYGAFELRQMSSKRHTLAILLSVTFFTLSISAPVLLRKISHTDVRINTEETTLKKIIIEKPLINPLIEQPQPQLQRTIQFTPPVVTNDPTEENAPPINDVIMSSTAAIGNRDQDGIDEQLPTETFQATEETVEPVRFVPQMPEFAGGEEARIQFLREHIKYPSIAAEMGITGKVILQFVVNKDGIIDKVSVIRGIGGGCDEEAIRVAKLMPPWKPGRQNGKAVPVYFIMPIGFTLQNQ